MRRLNGFNGNGYLIHKGEDLPVSYTISVFGDAYSRKADGVIQGDFDPNIALNLYTQSGLKLRMSNGHEVDILITGGMGPFEIAVNSELPTF